MEVYMSGKKTYLVSADGWPTKYIRNASTTAEARRTWQKMTGGPDGAKVIQVCGKAKRKGARNRGILE